MVQAYQTRTFLHVLLLQGSDGHTLALSVEGEVFSWGDGDYGKLGHGSNSTVKMPKLIVSSLAGKVS